MCDDWRALGELAGGAANAWEAFVAETAITLDAYKWAYATVKSRSAEVDVHGVPTKLLAPRFDLFNHSADVAPGSSHFYDEARGALVALAARDYAAGEQAFISYGSTQNAYANLLSAGGLQSTQDALISFGILPPGTVSTPTLPSAALRPSHRTRPLA